MIMFVQLQFDQEARRAMILQIGNYKGNVIFCRFLSWFLFYEYFIYLNAVISNGTFGAIYCSWNQPRIVRINQMIYYGYQHWSKHSHRNAQAKMR